MTDEVPQERLHPRNCVTVPIRLGRAVCLAPHCGAAPVRKRVFVIPPGIQDVPVGDPQSNSGLDGALALATVRLIKTLQWIAAYQ